MNLFLVIFYLLSVLFLYFVIHHKIINQNVKKTNQNSDIKEINNQNVKENTKNITKKFQYSIKPKYECRDFCSEEICNYYNNNEKNPKYTECQLYN